MKILKPTIAFIIALLTISMVQGDQKARVQACAEKAGEGAVYLKDFEVSLPAAVTDQPVPVYRTTVILRGNNIYRFNLCNEKGEAIIRIYDNAKMMVSSQYYQSEEHNHLINFLCKKTGKYTILISFRDGTAGEAVGIMSHVMQ